MPTILDTIDGSSIEELKSPTGSSAAFDVYAKCDTPHEWGPLNAEVGLSSMDSLSLAQLDFEDSVSIEDAMSLETKPFLKWPGGKRWFVARYSSFLLSKYNRYIEPFLGAGSVFFHLRPEHAILGDLTSDVITAFQGIKEDPDGVQLCLEEHHAEHNKEHYYKVRDDTVPSSLTERAGRIIYLNRTCFNGIYRVNRKGNFNVPIGTKNSVVLDTDDFASIAKLLSNAELLNSDFEPLIDQAREGDFVFLDPPYTVRHNRNGFIKYNEKLFSWEDQERLAEAATRAAERGAQILITNASHSTIRMLYNKSIFKFRTVSRFSGISASSSSRTQFEELVIANKHRRNTNGDT